MGELVRVKREKMREFKRKLKKCKRKYGKQNLKKLWMREKDGEKTREPKERTFLKKRKTLKIRWIIFITIVFDCTW